MDIETNKFTYKRMLIEYRRVGRRGLFILKQVTGFGQLIFRSLLNFQLVITFKSIQIMVLGASSKGIRITRARSPEICIFSCINNHEAVLSKFKFLVFIQTSYCI